MVNQQEADVIVVGSGPSGATVAKEMTEAGKKVTILEWGKHRPIKGNLLQAMPAVMMPGRSVLFTPEFAAVFRGIISGGSSVFYYGTAFDPPVEMFLKHGVDISTEVDEVRSELPTQPLNDSLIGPMAERIMSSAQTLGYDWQKLPKFIDQEKCKADCWRCTYGCPYDAKWSGKLFVDQALEKGAELAEGVRVNKVLVENGKATGVEGKQSGRTVQYFAPTVVISAGGIGSPRILESSGIEGTGKDFFFDPLIAAMGSVGDIKGGREIPMATGCHMEDEGYLMTDMTTPGTLFRALNAEVMKPHRMLSHGKTLTIMIKAKDDLGGQLTDGWRVNKPISEADRSKLMKGYERAKDILKKAGAKKVYKTWYLAAHPGGTAKIGEHLDTDLQTDIKNLYVCDCSVIPEAWGLPPTFSLICLGKRLAKHLSGEVKATTEISDSVHFQN